MVQMGMKFVLNFSVFPFQKILDHTHSPKQFAESSKVDFEVWQEEKAFPSTAKVVTTADVLNRLKGNPDPQSPNYSQLP